jgi:hypothetical protein
VGILVYIGYHMAKKDQSVYLELDEEGKVRNPASTAEQLREIWRS